MSFEKALKTQTNNFKFMKIGSVDIEKLKSKMVYSINDEVDRQDGDWDYIFDIIYDLAEKIIPGHFQKRIKDIIYRELIKVGEDHLYALIDNEQGFI